MEAAESHSGMDDGRRHVWLEGNRHATAPGAIIGQIVTSAAPASYGSVASLQFRAQSHCR
jgi:hypothetical protein